MIAKSRGLFGYDHAHDLRAPELSGRGENIVEIVIGLVIYAIIWTVVIFGSEYMNRNVQ